MHTLTLLSATLLVFTAAQLGAAENAFTRARAEFSTRLLRRESVSEPAPEPPPEQLRLVTYPGPLGPMAAYVSPDPADGRKRPAVVWLFGGFSNSIGDTAWTPGPPANDQSAAGFRQAGIVMLYPSLRGGNRNPGAIETFYGEVDDVIAATAHLATLPYVDPQRIYLGGHSTGGTLALLVAAASDRYRAVFALGPVDDVRGYGSEVLPFDLADPRESALRAPKRWLDEIRSPTFVFEGSAPPSNAESLRALFVANKNPSLKFRALRGENHFSIIAPLVREIARRINVDTGPAASIEFSELTEFARPPSAAAPGAPPPPATQR